MLLLIRLIWESFAFALQALRANMLRTILSLLGVTVGIFAIISIYTMVDSLERNIRKDLAFIGQNTLYIQKFPWIFEPNYPWWRYFRRPSNTVAEFKYLEKQCEHAQAVVLLTLIGGLTVKYESNSVKEVYLGGVSYDYDKLTDLEIAQGRYFNREEVDAGRAVALIGHNVAQNLFQVESPIGKTIKIKGRQFTVIGVLKKEGENIFGEPSKDIRIVIPYPAFSRMYLIGRKGLEPTIALKGYDYDPDLLQLENEVRGLMRTKRGLKPTEEDNFALNRSETLSQNISSVFQTISLAGGIIGLFSILVGGFGIANIMFVSVKERTNIIGIQKSLGAKNYFILLQFLFEAVFLSLFGGVIGIFLVFLLTIFPQDFFSMTLTIENVLRGLLIASFVGVVSGVVPAYVAARLDPVEAIRAK
ncbi:MAG: ABC transporter permease [Microscillaceae bacterium]|nr:ABC transporter permease [Microscillaceae bacterium]MDW8460146.1 ABC transporter permease [Cytophagales bacterium]